MFMKSIFSVVLLAVLTSAGYTEETAPKLKEVVVVFKTHYDIGYTDLASKVIDYYRTRMIDKALDVCDKSQGLPPEQRFVWTIPGWPMAKILADPQMPARRDRVMNALKQGWFVTHAMPYTLHTESLEVEELVRGLGFASNVARGADLPLPLDAKMTDVPSHSWVIPTLLKQAGVKFMHIGCNGASASPELPRLFWWEGPDGSRVLTMYSGEYGSGLNPPKDWPYVTWLALIHSGDNQGPPTPESVTDLLKKAQQELPGVKVRMGRLQDFADAVLAEGKEIPVVCADLPDTWIHGVMSMPVESGIARRVRPTIGTLEVLDTLLGLWGAVKPAEPLRMAEAYEHSMMFGEHTWGYDVKRFDPRVYGKEWEQRRAQGDYKPLEQSWVEKGGHVYAMEQLVMPALEARMEALAQAVDLDNQRIVVFNPLPWPCDGVVKVSGIHKVKRSLNDLAQNGRVAFDHDGDSVSFIARDVPPTGYRTYAFEKAWKTKKTPDLAVDKAAHRLSNEFFQVEVDPKRGCIASLVELKTGRELVDSNGEYGLGQYLYERFSKQNSDAYLRDYPKTQASWVEGDFGKPGLPPADEAPYRALTHGDWTVDMECGKTSVCVRMHAKASEALPQDITLTITLYSGMPYLDIEWTIQDKSADPWPEAGWLCFPLGVSKPRFELGRLGGIVNPVKDIVRGANHDMYCLNSGMAVFGEGGEGIGLCPLDSPLVSLGRPGLFRYSKEYLPSNATVFVNLYNNQWGTNFQQWTGGSWNSRVRVWAISKKETPGSWVTKAWEARMPLLAAHAQDGRGPLPFTQAGVQLSRKGILLTSFGQNPDGPGTVLRLWEQCGADGPCKVILPSGSMLSNVQPCSLRGEAAGAPLPVETGSFSVEMPHYAPVSVLIDSTL